LIRHRIGRLATISTAVAVLASVLLAGGALAANGRNVYFGSPSPGTGGGYNADGSLIFGTLVNTRVTANNRTAVLLTLRNDDNQTLNHVKIAGGDAADGKPYNPAFPKPTSGDSLPSALTFSAVTILSGPAGATCDTNTSVSFECDLGSLAADAGAQLLIVIKAPNVTANTSYPYWFTGSWNEGWSSTGNNADYNFATGSILVEASTCAGGTASWFLGNEQVELGDGGDTCFNQDAAIKSGRNGGVALGGNGGFATVAVDDTFEATCPAGYKCFGNTISVSVLGGDPVPGGVEWKGTWFGTKTIKGVIHFGDDYATDATDFTAIAFTKANKCTTTKLTDCWVSLTTSVGNTKPQFVTATWVTDSNGKGGGFF
jgi:hypothetical protein